MLILYHVNFKKAYGTEFYGIFIQFPILMKPFTFRPITQKYLIHISTINIQKFYQIFMNRKT